MGRGSNQFMFNVHRSLCFDAAARRGRQCLVAFLLEPCRLNSEFLVVRSSFGDCVDCSLGAE